MSHPKRSALLVLAAIVFVGAWADDLPDSDVNPVTGSIESVESFTENGKTNIRHTIDPGQGAPSVSTTLSSHSSPDRSPRIAIRSDGAPAVVWWRDASTDVVLLRERSGSAGTWSSETQLNASGTAARNPEMVADGTTVWIVFEVDVPGGGTSVELRGVMDDPLPIITIKSLVTYTGNLDTLIHLDQGDLWVTWVDSGSDVGWSEYDAASDTWSLPSYESYATDTVADARARIKSTVTAN